MTVKEFQTKVQKIVDYHVNGRTIADQLRDIRTIRKTNFEFKYTERKSEISNSKLGFYVVIEVNIFYGNLNAAFIQGQSANFYKQIQQIAKQQNETNEKMDKISEVSIKAQEIILEDLRHKINDMVMTGYYVTNVLINWRLDVSYYLPNKKHPKDYQGTFTTTDYKGGEGINR